MAPHNADGKQKSAKHPNSCSHPDQGSPANGTKLQPAPVQRYQICTISQQTQLVIITHKYLWVCLLIIMLIFTTYNYNNESTDT